MIKLSEKTDKINNEALELCNKRANLEKCDVIFSGIVIIGEIAIVSEPPTNWSIKEGIYVLKPDLSIICSKYLMYLLQTTVIKEKYSKKLLEEQLKVFLYWIV